MNPGDELYPMYLEAGFRPLRCRGYHSNHNPEKDYRVAKTPLDEGFTEEQFRGLTPSEIKAWESKGGWVGWLIPEGRIFIDVEGQDKLHFLDTILNKNHLTPPIHKTNKGRHYGFASNNGLTGASSVFTRSGLEVTYRVGGKNQLILAPTNERFWERPLSKNVLLPPLPDELLPYDKNNLQEVIKCLAWQVGAHYRNKSLQGNEDVDLSFMSFLIQSGVGYEDIQRAFSLVFLNEYDQRRTEQLFQRTNAKIEAGESIKGAGSFVHLVKDRPELKSVYRFVGEVHALTGKGQRASNKKTFKAVSISNLLTHEFKPRKALLHPWLNSQGLAMIHAPRGIGKTLFAIDLTVAGTSGGAFLRWKAPEPFGVLYLDGEMPGVVLQERFARSIRSSETDPLAPLYIITPDLQENGMPDLSTTEGQEALEPHLEGVSLIIVDNLSTLVRSGRESDGDDWVPVQEWALRLRSKGYAITFIHHDGKGGQQRGTSKREDVLDTVIHLKRPGDYKPEEGARFEVHFEKSRMLYGDDVRAFEAKLVTRVDGTQEWALKDLEQSLTERVANLINEGVLQHEIADLIGVAKGTVSKHKNKAQAQGLLKK